MADPVTTAQNGRIETALPALADRLIATSGLMLATAIQAADALIANVALPRLEADLGGGIDLGTWVITSYLCATAVMAPLTGWLRRRYGAMRLFPGAVGIFAIASLLCAFAPSVGAIILFRIVQGAAGGVIHPLAQAIVLDIYPASRHAKMLAVLGAGVMAGPILGPPLGGVITDVASWRWVFAINLPLGLFSIWCVARLRSLAETAPDQHIDVLGIPLTIAAVGGFALLLHRGVGQDWLHSPEIIGEATISIAAFALLVGRARYGGLTAFRPAVFKDANFVIAAFNNFMLSAILFVTVVFLPLLGEGPLGFPAALAGAAIVPRAIVMTLVILIVGQVIDRVGHLRLLLAGWALMAVGLVVLAGIRPESGVTWIIAGSTIQAVGAGMLYTPLTTLAFATLAQEIRTDATGLYSLLRQLGYASGVALMSAVLQSRITTHLAALPSAAPVPDVLVQSATLAAYSDCFALMGIAAVVLIPGVLLIRTGRPVKTDDLVAPP